MSTPMEEALRAYLLADTGTAALVGTQVAWNNRPQAGALPSVTLAIIDAIPVYSNDGDSGLTQSRVEADCWGETYSSAKLVSRAVKARLSAAVAIQDGVTFQSIWTEREEDMFEDEPGGTQLHRISLDFQVWHS